MIREYYKATKSPKTFYEYITKMLAKHDEVPYFEEYEEWEAQGFHYYAEDPWFKIVWEWDDGYGYYYVEER